MEIQSLGVALNRVRGVLIFHNICKIHLGGYLSEHLYNILFADMEVDHDYSFLCAFHIGGLAPNICFPYFIMIELMRNVLLVLFFFFHFGRVNA